MGEKVQVAAKKPEVKRENQASKSRNADQSQSMSSPVDQVLYLQRTIGNQAVQKLARSGALQAKLRIGQQGDKYEQEADRVAGQVMSMPELPLQRQTEEEEEKEILQTKENPSQTPEVTSDIESRINSIRGGGHPLPESTRSFFEQRFGYDFRQVRAHADAKTAESARVVNAKAYTIGQDVAFGMGQYVPETEQGKRLLAHELTHVVQQGRGVSLERFPHYNTRGLQRKDKIHIQPTGITPTIQREEEAKMRKDAFDKECPDNVVLAEKKAIPKFNKMMFNSEYRTYFGTVTNMKVGPKDSYESCITEVLKVEENTCGNKGKMADYKPCGPKKFCMKVNKACGGDSLTKTTFPCSSNTFVDLHRTRRTFNLMENSGNESCKVKCLQRYGCGRKEIGRFYVTRYFKADKFIDGKKKVPITMGTIEIETAKKGT